MHCARTGLWGGRMGNHRLYPAADGEQAPLVPRSTCSSPLMPGVRPEKIPNENDSEGMRVQSRSHFIVVVSFALVLAATPCCLAQTSCEKLKKLAQAQEAAFYPRRGYIVGGKGRLYFHTAPDSNCRSKDIFVIQGDHLVAYSEHGGWYSVMYLNPKTGEDYEGWVRPERLKYQGTLGPRHE